ncbi:MAG: DUF2958 domain-containing protein [Chloroflexota bacterium]|nr:DUF2958 domain-containing protein [Chloroflexota bacterium]
MTDQRETATTMWQDQHAGKRGHQLMTEKLADTIPALYAKESGGNYDTVLAHAKLFSPYTNWTWFITEMDPATGTCFGLVDGFEQEIGYFDLTELAETTVFGGVPAVERDLYWEPRAIGEIKHGSRQDTPFNGAIREGETMSEETGTESQSPDVVNVEEFLFGGVTEETADDAPADADREIPAREAMDDTGDLEVAEETDGETDTATEEPGTDDAAGEQPAPAETEGSEELKVVLSIRGNRATIGVQRPSADPHIESFDDPDLFGLADQFPAVVARAKARWEEEPMHPAYVKPAPPPRQRNRRQQGAAQAPIVEEGEVEAEQQPQPETLRLF